MSHRFIPQTSEIVEWCKLAQERCCYPGGHQRYPMSLRVCLRILTLKSEDLWTCEAMMCFATGNVGELSRITQNSIKLVAFFLRTCILPIRTVWVRESFI